MAQMHLISQPNTSKIPNTDDFFTKLQLEI